MSTANQGKRSRWMDWEPKAQASGVSEPEVAKPPKPGFEGFEGAVPGKSQNSGVGFDGFEGAIPGESEKIQGGQEPPNLAPCGSPHCGGCYEVAPGVRLHPPKVSPEWTAWLNKCQTSKKLQ
jgi:hypothetical protein